MDDQKEDIKATIDGPERHPSYGMAIVSRTTCHPATPMFGSSIRHSHYISLEIHYARINRSLCNDWIHAGDTIVEVAFSLTQWAELVAGIGVGSGTPCTITATREDGRIERPPFVDKRAQFEQEFRDHMQVVARKLDALLKTARDIHTKPSATKADRDDLVKRIESVRQEIASNMPFVAAQFNEQMEKTVTEAKGEVEAFVLSRIIDAGLTALGSVPQIQIEDSDD